MKKKKKLMTLTGTTKSILSITALLLTASVVQGGVIPTNIVHQQSIFADTYEGDTELAADVGGYKSYLGAPGSIISTTGASGAISNVLQVNKTSATSSQPTLLAYFSTTDPVNPASYTLNHDPNYDPGGPHSNYIRMSFDWKPVSGYAGTDSAADSFVAQASSQSAPNVNTGAQTFITGTSERYSSPLSGWHLYARGPGGINDSLSGGGNGEVFSTGTDQNQVPDGRWYNIVSEFSVPDASGNYDWSTEFTPYDLGGGALLTASTATTGGSGTLSSSDGDFTSFIVLGGGGSREYTWNVDNLQADLIVVSAIPEPSSLALALLIGTTALMYRRRRR